MSFSRWMRVVASLALGSAVGGAAAVAGCASTGDSCPPGAPCHGGGGSASGSGSGSFGDDAGAQSTCPPGITKISVAPGSTSIDITLSSTMAAATQMLTATGTFSDGHTADVSSCAAWQIDPQGAYVSNGVFSTTSPGQYTVTAASGNAQGSATITVRLTGTVNAGNVDATKLDGAANGPAPRIAYPLDGALFPAQFGDLSFQMVPGAAAQSIARIALEGSLIDVKVYAPCAPIPSAAIAGACSVAIPGSLEGPLAGASEAGTLTETVRLAAPDGSNLGESAPISAAWSSASLTGTIYYWSAPPGGMTGASAILRMNLDMPGTAPEIYLTNDDDTSYAPPLSGGWACVGCHAISQDGTKMGITIAGSSVNTNGDGYGSLFALLDIGSKTRTASRITDDGGQQLLNTGFATFTTFSPDGNDMVQELQGQLFVRSADATLASQGPLFTNISEKLTHPNWSQTGDRLVFTSWVPDLSIPHNYDSKDLNGNETPNAQIWTASVNGTTFGTPSVLVPRVANASEYYPALSDDSALVVFNESSCAGPPTPSADGYGGSPCDGYDDPSSRLRLVATAGGAPVELDKASGRTSQWPNAAGGTWTNSWPRFSPHHSTFRGKTLYWVAFSSRRPYGATLPGSTDGTTAPQLWFAAVTVDPSGMLSGDPSFAPVWLPQQNSASAEVLPDGGTFQPFKSGGPTGNHVPQWVVKYVKYMPIQ